MLTLDKLQVLQQRRDLNIIIVIFLSHREPLHLKAGIILTAT